MPILKVDKPKQLIVMKRSLTRASPASTTRCSTRTRRRMLFGDAKKSVQDIVTELAEL